MISQQRLDTVAIVHDAPRQLGQSHRPLRVFGVEVVSNLVGELEIIGIQRQVGNIAIIAIVDAEKVPVILTQHDIVIDGIDGPATFDNSFFDNHCKLFGSRNYPPNPPS